MVHGEYSRAPGDSAPFLSFPSSAGREKPSPMLRLQDRSKLPPTAGLLALGIATVLISPDATGAPTAVEPAAADLARSDSAAVAAAPTAPADTTGGPEFLEPELEEVEKHSRWVPPRLVQGRVIFLPEIHHSSEAGFGFGGEVVRPFRFPSSDPRTLDSELRVEGQYTVKGQGEIELRSTLEFAQGRWVIHSKLGYDSMPHRFWGVGPNTPSENEEIYRPQILLGYVEIIRRVVDGLKLGLRYEIQGTKMLEFAPGGILDIGGLRGVEGGHGAGAGMILEWDTRDRKYAPRSGNLVQGFAMVFDGELGSDYDFNQYNLDVRHYTKLAFRHVLATQFFLYAARGAPPFWRLAALGGRQHTRGYRFARYLDNVLLAFQGEYRVPLWWRFGIVGFAGLGGVAAQYRGLQLQHMRPTVGGGLRIRASDRTSLQVRGDVAFGEGSLRFYFGLGDSF
jgi:hypothetical protein